MNNPSNTKSIFKICTTKRESGTKVVQNKPHNKAICKGLYHCTTVSPQKQCIYIENFYFLNKNEKNIENFEVMGEKWYSGTEWRKRLYNAGSRRSTIGGTKWYKWYKNLRERKEGDYLELRGYQKQLITDIRQSISNGNRSIVSVLGCGGG